MEQIERAMRSTQSTAVPDPESLIPESGSRGATNFAEGKVSLHDAVRSIIGMELMQTGQETLQDIEALSYTLRRALGELDKAAAQIRRIVASIEDKTER